MKRRVTSVLLLVGVLLGALYVFRGNEWPLRVRLRGTVKASEALRWPGTPREALRDVFVDADEYGTGELLFRPTGDVLVLVDLPGDPRWVKCPSPLSAGDTDFLRELGTEVHVSFFQDGTRAIVHAEDGVMAVELGSQRVRMLDHRASMLENCRMGGGRSAYECALDLDWSSAEFDADGNEVSGNFTPAWAR